MKIWARMLADLPPTLQRLIARSQRISLPRSCPAPERLRRLRAALCRQRTVRVTYFALPPDVQAAIQELRTTPRGLAPVDLTVRAGPIRPWSQDHGRGPAAPDAATLGAHHVSRQQSLCSRGTQSPRGITAIADSSAPRGGGAGDSRRGRTTLLL